jgi:hypothetical protein
MAQAKKQPFAPGPRSYEAIRARECERAGITLDQFDDFESTDTLVRSVQDYVIWRMHTEIPRQRGQIDVLLSCARVRVTEAISKEPTIPTVGARLTTVTQTESERRKKIALVINAAAKRFHHEPKQFRTRVGIAHEDAIIGAILLVLEYRGVASFHAIEELGCTDAAAQETLRGSSQALLESGTMLYHKTHDLCEELGIDFVELLKSYR